MARNYLTGPFNLYYGSIDEEHRVMEVSEVSFDYSSDSSQPTTIDGRTFDIPTTTSVSATVTLLGATPDTLGRIFPLKKKVLGETVSTGEVVTATETHEDPIVLDLTSVNACETDTPLDLYLVGCDVTYRMNDCTAKIDSIDIEDNILINVSVIFTSTPQLLPDGTLPAYLQVYPTGSLVAAS